MRIIQQRERKESTSYFLAYAWNKDDPHSGFAFDCDKEGKPLREYSNLEKCKANGFDKPIYFIGIEERTHSWIEPRIGKCECGQEVYLDRFTNTCDGCDRDYNSAGQELTPREQWGEETSEQLSDILQIK